ncbi:MAG: DUF2922 domain-containing protein [Tissierellia bacterium]|nr:DUF2922 domain-containing protein [Tissierellia bacterium]
MTKSKLEMEFKDVAGKKFNLSLDEPKDNLTESDIRTAMEEVVNRNIFSTKEGDIVETVKARVIKTEIEEIII